MSHNETPRYIDPLEIEIGDLIKVRTKEQGIVLTRTGRVAKRSYEGRVRVYTTLEGGELLSVIPGVKPPIVTLINKTAPLPEPLFEMLDGVAI